MVGVESGECGMTGGGAGDAAAGADTAGAFGAPAGRSSIFVGATSQLSSVPGAFGACTPSIVVLPTRGGAACGCTFGAETPFGATAGACGEGAGFGGPPGSGGFGGDPGPRAPAWLMASIRCPNLDRSAMATAHLSASGVYAT